MQNKKKQRGFGEIIIILLTAIFATFIAGGLSPNLSAQTNLNGINSPVADPLNQFGGQFRSLLLHTFHFAPASSPESCAKTPITLDATSKTNGDSVSQITWSHTTKNSCSNVLIVGVVISDAKGRGTFDISSVTYGGVSLTKIAALNNPSSGPGSNSYHTEMWYLIGPKIGTYTIIAQLRSLAGGAWPDAVAGAETFYNVNPTNPLGTFATNSGSTSPASLSIATIPNQVVVDVVGGTSSTAIANDPSQTQLWFQAVKPGQIGTTGSSSDKTAVTNTTLMQWSNISSWTIIGLPINP